MTIFLTKQQIDETLPKIKDGILKICEIHDRLAAGFASFLQTENGCYLVSQFKIKYPNAKISEVKMLDMVLWKYRSEN